MEGANVLPNIGLAGKAGSGKGVLAAELVKRGYEVVSFAFPIKVAIDQFAYDQLHPCCGQDGCECFAAQNVNEWARQHKEALRPAYQWFGQFMRETVAPDYWITGAIGFAQHCNRQGQPVVLDDVRYPNEVEALKAAGFTIFRIDRTPWHRQRFGGVTLEGDQATHSSEAQIDDLPVDYSLVNDANPHSLYLDLAAAMGWLHG